MKGTNVIITDGLKENLKDFAKEVCIRAATYARDTLTDVAYEAFERFYCNYTPVMKPVNTLYEWKFETPEGVPKKYRRTYNILKYGIRSFDNLRGKVIRGGVELDPSRLKDNYDNATPTEVFESIYEFGWHGPIWSRIPPMDPTPEQLINQSYDNLCNYVIATVVRSEIPNILQNGNYEYLHRKTYKVSTRYKKS